MNNDQVPVTQEDQQLTARFSEWLLEYGYFPEEPDAGEQQRIKWFGEFVDKAIARHRTTSTAAKDAEIARKDAVIREARIIVDKGTEHDCPGVNCADCKQRIAFMVESNQALSQPPQTAPDDVVALLREALAKYGKCLRGCDNEFGGCDCGFKTTLASMGEG